MNMLQLEYEIQTLRNVLVAKMNEASDLKRKLGITPMVELKQDLVSGFHTIKESEPYVIFLLLNITLIFVVYSSHILMIMPHLSFSSVFMNREYYISR
jgi:hypothetical protein